MADKTGFHVTPHGENEWAVIREGSGSPLSTHPTQAEAEREGRELAARDEVEFMLHGADGEIREKDSYGEDSRAIPG